MTIDQFAEITRRIIARDGFEGYLPTACYPSRSLVAVLEGVPGDIDLEAAALKWAMGGAEQDEEVLVAFKRMKGDSRWFGAKVRIVKKACFVWTAWLQCASNRIVPVE